MRPLEGPASPLRRGTRRALADSYQMWVPGMARGLTGIRAFLQVTAPTSAGLRRVNRGHLYQHFFFAPALVPTPRWRDPEWTEVTGPDDTFTEV